MEIIFLRHAPAEDKEEWTAKGHPDAQRPLTADGRKRARDAAKGLAAVVGKADLVASSPLVRAWDTAEFAAKALGAPLVETGLLLPHRSPASLAAWLSQLGEERVVLVGHEPHLSRAASWLLSGGVRSFLDLRKAQAALVTTKRAAAGQGTLIWSLPPRVLRALG